MSLPVIEIENLGKQYRLGQVGTTTLANDLKRWWHLVRGKEDPFLLVGEANDRTKKGNSEYVWALRDVNFSVQQGEVLGVIGKNGAGKSTLLKILSRTTTPSRGEYRIKGRVASLLEVGTGFHPDLTGRENVFLNGAILGMNKKEIARKFDEIVDFSGVERYIDTPVKRYSSGMYVRLAFAVAAHLEPEILILDEVLAVGDAEFQKKCLGKMQDVSGQGRTVLFVSHNLTAVASLCTRTLYLNSGMVKGIGDTNEMITKYLGDGTERSNSKSWKNDLAPGDNKVKLRCIRTVSETADSIDLIYLHKTFGVEITYEILQEISQPVPQVHVFTQKDDVVFVSYGKFNVNKLEKSEAKPGIYKSTVWFPQDLLNAGVYNLGVGFSDMQTKQLHFYDDSSISIEVIEDFNFRELDFSGTIGGLVRPKLEWRTEKLNNDEQ
jgi:lipopolysaccharide transport system ATP-binding protein